MEPTRAGENQVVPGFSKHHRTEQAEGSIKEGDVVRDTVKRILHFAPNYKSNVRCGPQGPVQRSTPPDINLLPQECKGGGLGETHMELLYGVGVPIGLLPARKHRAKRHTVGPGALDQFCLR